MKTDPLPHSITPAPAEVFSANELSFADTLTLDLGSFGKEHVSVVVALHLATKCFRATVPFTLWSANWSKPLITYDGTSLSVMPAIRSLVTELDAIFAEEQEIGAQFAVERGRVPAAPSAPAEEGKSPEATLPSTASGRDTQQSNATSSQAPDQTGPATPRDSGILRKPDDSQANRNAGRNRRNR